MKKKGKSVYADLSTKRVIAPNKKANEPKNKKICSEGDLRAKAGG